MEHSLPVTPIGPAKEAWSLVESGIVRYWGNKKEGLAIEIEDDEADDAFSRRCSGLRRHLISLCLERPVSAQDAIAIHGALAADGAANFMPEEPTVADVRMLKAALCGQPIVFDEPA